MKTVYILGAGFSMEAGAPSQIGLSKAIFDLKETPGHNSDKLNQLFNIFEDFLQNKLNINPLQFPTIPLEDIFTPLDKCIIEGISYRGVEPKMLSQTREAIYSLIILALQKKLDNASKEYIDLFAKYLTLLSKKRITNGIPDPVSVITTNWDILLDNSLKTLIDRMKEPNEQFAGVVDYCCYLSSQDEHDHSIKPGLYAHGMNKFNVKILKLHGSMNWVHCPKCQRLFVKFFEKTAGDIVFNKQHCRHCKLNFSENDNNSNKLVSNLIMPTFLKDLSNFQIKLIWQNAGVEISEANKLVFIGYSLPQADFDLRQLLSRMTKKDAEIEVILSKNDKPKKSHSWAYPETRYRTFFGDRNITFRYIGASKYINTTIQKKINALDR